MLKLADGFGRVATDLRVSLTDRCNLRCTYCMPPEGLAWAPSDTLLSDDELVRLVGLAVSRLGITEVRLTGGEPTLRPSLVDLVARLTSLRPRPAVSLTTNGLRLVELAAPLAAAGLERVNVSLDTLRPDRFVALTRRARLDDVFAGIAAARAAGLSPVKVNAVLMRGVNDDEAAALLAWSLEQGLALRFIEWMPLDAQHQWSRDQLVTGPEILAALRRSYSLSPVPGRGSAPAEEWLVDGGPATVGVIASVTSPFCAACDRMRLTADGQLRNCLFGQHETDLRALLRSGAGDEAILAAWLGTAAAKKAGHGIGDPGFTPPQRPMSAIGG